MFGDKVILGLDVFIPASCSWSRGILVISALCSLQITPTCNLPLKCLRGGGKVVIVNLQVFLYPIFIFLYLLYSFLIYTFFIFSNCTENSKRQESKYGHPWICRQGVFMKKKTILYNLQKLNVYTSFYS